MTKRNPNTKPNIPAYNLNFCFSPTNRAMNPFTRSNPPVIIYAQKPKLIIQDGLNRNIRPIITPTNPTNNGNNHRSLEFLSLKPKITSQTPIPNIRTPDINPIVANPTIGAAIIITATIIAIIPTIIFFIETTS